MMENRKLIQITRFTYIISAISSLGTAGDIKLTPVAIRFVCHFQTFTTASIKTKTRNITVLALEVHFAQETTFQDNHFFFTNYMYQLSRA